MIKNRIKFKSNLGYSLIEMIIAMAIIAIFFGAGIANYRRLNSRKQIEGAAKQIESAIRKTQKNASAGVKNPATWCNDASDELVSYTIQLGSPANNQYSITALCNDTSTQSDTFTLENKAVIDSVVSYKFDLYGKSATNGTVCVRDKDNKFHYQISVTQGGSVSVVKASSC